MAFQLEYFGPLSVGQNTSFTIDYDSQDGTAQGAQNAFTYNGASAGDDLAALQSSNYFLPIVGQIELATLSFVAPQTAMESIM